MGKSLLKNCGIPRISFLELCKLWDGVGSVPIKTQEQRIAIRGLILRWKARGLVVRCFRDYPGFLMVAQRRPRLNDFFG
jgi:hypothetical protein